MFKRSPVAVCLSGTRAFSTSINRVPLVFDFYEPPSGRQTSDAAIVFLHGLFGSKKNNRSISKVLAKDLGRPVYAIDLRNHGESPHDPRHDYLAMAADVAGFIETRGLKQTTIIGHSMGAKTAMTLALEAPDLMDNIVSVDNAPVDAVLQSSFGKYVQGMRKIEEARVTRQSEADEILKPYEESLTVRQFLLGNLHSPQGEKTKKFRVPLKILGSSLDNMGDFPFKNPDEIRFEKPALFVRGTQSRYVADEAIPIIGRFFPRFRMVDIDAGHWVISEKPEEFRQAVVEFLTPQQ